MKARVNTYLNIRTGTPEVLLNNNTGDAYYKPGEVIDIAETVIGESIKKNNVWYKLENGAFVWSGGVEEFSEQEILKINSLIENKFLWPIRKFKINSLWPFLSGKGITIAVIDTGIDTNHPDLKESINRRV